MTKLRKKIMAFWLTLLTFSFMFGGGISVHLGQDANWDLKNYHLYNAWAYLHDKLSEDIFAAGIQSYFSPLVDLPYYLLGSNLLPNSPRLVAFLMGFPYGFLLFVVFAMAWIVIGQIELTPAKKILLSILITAFGTTGVATISQIGTTFNEIPAAATTLAGFLFIIIAIADLNSTKPNQSINRYLTISGVLFGFAAGLKLTACIYAPGAVIVVGAINGDFRQRFSRMFIFSAAWAIAFLILWAPWGISLYKLTENPLFPFFNSFFHSPWIASSGGLDTRFIPKSFFEAIFYPFYWANNPSMTVMEPKFTDPRFAIVFALLLFSAALSFLLRFRSTFHRRANPYIFTPVDGVLLFVVISYVIWEALFSILRYAATLESILGLVLFAIAIRIVSIFKFKSNFVTSIILFISALIGVLTVTKYPVWGRVPYSQRVFEVKTSSVPDHSLILFIGSPIAYLAPFLAQGRKNLDFVGINDSTLVSDKYDLGKIVKDKIAGWHGPIYYVARKETLSSSGVLKSFLLFPAGNCEHINSNIDETVYICPATKSPNSFIWPTLLEDRNYFPGNLINMSEVGDGKRYLNGGWSSQETWGTWTDAAKANIILRFPDNPTGSLIFDFMSHAFVTPKHPLLRVSILVNGLQLRTFEYSHPQDASDSLRSFEIPPELLAKSKAVLNIEFQMSSPASPSSLGLSADSRTLGLGMAWLKIAPLNKP